MRTFVMVIVGLLVGLIAGILLSELIGIVGYLILGVAVGIKFLPLYLAGGCALLALLMERLIWRGVRR